MTAGNSVRSWICRPEACKPKEFLHGPASLIANRGLVYPCHRGNCQIGCPCHECIGTVSKKTLSKQEKYDNHLLYHHAQHLKCEFCNE